MERFLAFRCYGDFSWPPLPDAADAGDPKLGVVEIHYVPEGRGAGLSWVGHLRWLPKDVDWDQAWPTDPVLDLYALGKARLLELLGDGSVPIVLRFQQATGKAVRPPLRFEGATALDQFDVPRQGGGAARPACSLRLPLVSHLVSGRRSALQIGNGSKSDSLRLELALPLPVAPNRQQQNATLACVAFSVLYQSTLRTVPQEQPLSFHTMAFGFARDDIPATTYDASLGAMQIAPYRGEPADATRRAGDARVPFDGLKFWADSSFVLSSVLADFGFPVAFRNAADRKKAAEALSTRTRLIETDGLARFPGIHIETVKGERNPGFRIRQRFALVVNAANGAGSTLASDEGAWRCVDNDIQLRLAADTPRWLSFGDHLFMEVALSGSIADDDVWDPGRATSRCELSYNVGSVQQLSTSLDGGKELPAYLGEAPAALSLGELLGQTITAMRLTLASRRQLAPARPLSVLPELTTTTRSAHFGLFARVGVRGQDAVIGKALVPLSERQFHASLQPAEGASLRGSQVEFRARWPGFDTAPPDAPAIGLIASHAGSRLVVRDRSRPFVLRLHDDAALTEKSATPRQSVLDGMSLDWQVPLLVPPGTDGDPAQGDEASTLHMGWPQSPGGWRIPPGERASLLPRCLGDFNLRLTMRPRAVRPLTAENLAHDRSGRSAVLLLHGLDAGSAANAWWVVSEESVRVTSDNDDDGWRLTADLIDRSATSAPEGATSRPATVMFSDQPFSFMRYRTVPLGQRGGESNGIVAKYDSVDGGWEILQTSPYYQYELPPQSIGESMDKPGRLEIHDLAEEIPSGGFARPYPPEAPPDGGPAVDRRHLVDFRLTPPAGLWIRPADVERNYLLPEWASRQLFSQSGQRGVGAALEAFRGEFVYGLPVGIRSVLEAGPARTARVAEIEALTGSVLPSRGRPLQEDAWERIRSAYQRRPERLEFWADDPVAGRPFAPAKFSKARFALRTSALHRPAVATASQARPSAARLAELTPRLHPQGLAGGALWPIESANVLAMLLDAPRADGGEVESIALGPTGGDADQTVRFCNGKVSIITETRNGYIQRQRVEVVGRIAVWWNRAKHVVVYERTVNPSAQFTPAGGVLKRTRRPVLRKVREFVELMQPERRYPDAANQSAAGPACAFVRGLRFNSTVIAVDSFWGEDVGTVGWRVPLWNRHAARQRPQVYGMPDVVFLQASEGTPSDAITAQQCLNPDDLHFFTDTSGATSDTDRWKPEIAVDWVNLPLPRSMVGTLEQSASEPAVPPGFERFTWRLAPAARRTTVNQSRGDKPVYAAISTLTFMRAVGQEGDPVVPPRAAAPAVPTGWVPGVALHGDCPVELRTLAESIRRFALPPEPPSDDASRAALQSDVDRIKQSVLGLGGSAGLKQLIDRQIADLDSFRSTVAKSGEKAGVADLHGLLAAPRCGEWKKSLLGAIGAKRLMVDQELLALEERAVRTIRGWAADAERSPLRTLDSAALKAMLRSQLTTALTPGFEGLSVEIGKVDRGCEAVSHAVAGLGGDLHEIVERARRDLDAVRGTIDHGKPWSEYRLSTLRSQIDGSLRKAQAQILGTVEDVRRRIVADVDDVARTVGEATAAALRGFHLTAGDVLAWPGTATGGDWPLNVFRPLREALERAEDADPATEGSLVWARALVEKERPQLDQISADLADDLLHGLDELGLVVSGLREAVASLEPSVERLSVESMATVSASIEKARILLEQGSSRVDDITELVSTRIGADVSGLAGRLTAAVQALRLRTDRIVDLCLDERIVSGATGWVDLAVLAWSSSLSVAFADVDRHVGFAAHVADDAVKALRLKLGTVRNDLSQDAVTEAIASRLFAPIDAMLEASGVRLPVVEVGEIADVCDRLVAVVGQWRAQAARQLELPETLLGNLTGPLERACEFFEPAASEFVEALKRKGEEVVHDVVDRIKGTEIYKELEELDTVIADAARYRRLVEDFRGFERDVARAGTELGRAGELADAYAQRATQAIGNIGRNGLFAAPNDILRAMAAVGDVPHLPNLDYARKQIGYYYGRLNEVVDITPVEAYFGRLGESLKAWGLSLPVSRIGDGLLPDDLGGFDIGQVFRNCGGMQLENLFKGCKLPAGSDRYVKLTHDFNKESMRAWVQLDVDVPLPGRNALVGMGPFSLNAVDTRLVGKVRLEASKDTDRVDDQGEASLRTDFEAMVGGQVMVTLRDVTVRFSKVGGLQVDFDPQKIRINPSLEFVQNTLGTIFGDECGGMTVLKRDGIPVGLEHLFSMPPTSLMFGTSGLQNIQLSNQFQLIAYPDFRIANRFSLARPELPFSFSVFIVGGTGWLTVDVDYRPFSGELMVVVDAAIGGSASLGFGFAGCTGSVAITFSGALTYRKLIGNSGGGLAVSMVVTITGVVDVLRIASAHLAVVLRLTYADNGDIDASGRFRLEIRISRFFKVSAGGQARYHMTGGQNSTQSSSSASVVPSEELQQARQKASRLLNGQR